MKAGSQRNSKVSSSHMAATTVCSRSSKVKNRVHKMQVASYLSCRLVRIVVVLS